MKARWFTGLLVAILGLNCTWARGAATVVYYSPGTTGTGQQTIYAPTTPISGTMSTTLPLFSPLLGTLIQADFEFTGNTNGAWTAAPSTTGTIDLNLSGPADVGGQGMGILFSGFSSAPIVDNTPIPYGAVGFANATFTIGPFFNSLTGFGNVPLSWQYSGSSAISTPAIGVFDWGGSAHVLYTYVPIPEPASLAFAAAGLMMLRRRRA